MGLFLQQLRHHDCKKNSRLRIEGETKRIKYVIHIVFGISQQNSPRNIATNIFQRNGNPSLQMPNHRVCNLKTMTLSNTKKTKKMWLVISHQTLHWEVEKDKDTCNSGHQATDSVVSRQANLLLPHQGMFPTDHSPGNTEIQQGKDKDTFKTCFFNQKT